MLSAGVSSRQEVPHGSAVEEHRPTSIDRHETLLSKEPNGVFVAPQETSELGNCVAAIELHSMRIQ